MLGFNEPDNVNQADDTAAVSSKTLRLSHGQRSQQMNSAAKAKGSGIMLGFSDPNNVNQIIDTATKSFGGPVHVPTQPPASR